MAKAVALRHVAFEDLGTFEDVLSDRGFDITYLKPGEVDPAQALEADLAIILGAPVSVNETLDYPWLEDEIAFAKARLDADKPTLGICLGAQIMARALGAAVEPAPEQEIGFSLLFLTESGWQTPLKHFARDHFVLHWHGENCDLPEGAQWLAFTELCPYQAFQVGHNGLALQFHPEVRAGALEDWLIGHAHEINHAVSARPRQLRVDAERWGAALEPVAKSFFTEWLDSVGL